MRRLTPYEEYLYKLEEQADAPDWLKQARDLLFWSYHLDKRITKTSLSKADIKWFSHYDSGIQNTEELPIELKIYVEKTVSIIREMYSTLMENPKENFLNIDVDYTLTKKGRKITREYANRFNSVPWPEVPAEK